MDKRRQRQAIQDALNTALSGLADDPHLARRVIAEAKGAGRAVRAKRKLAVGWVLAIALILSLATAAAAVLLSMQQVVEQEVVPMAQANDGAEINETFSSEELAHIVRLAEESGLSIPEELLRAVEQDRGDYEEETIMSLAREAFGGPYIEWTIEQKHWFDEMMVAIGFRDRLTECLPQEGEIPYEQALGIVASHILAGYGDDIRDASRWKTMVSYYSATGEDGLAEAPLWSFYFQPLSPQDSVYTLTLDSSGAILATQVEAAPKAESTAEDWIAQYLNVYGSFTELTCATWASLGEQIEGLDPGTMRGWILQNAGYRRPPDEGISEQEAMEIALKALNKEYTTVRSAFCCTAADGSPIWKVTSETMRPEDEGSGTYTAIWLLEIDCMTGAVREIREYVVGTSDPMIQWVPWGVYEHLPPIPEAPNG